MPKPVLSMLHWGSILACMLTCEATHGANAAILPRLCLSATPQRRHRVAISIGRFQLAEHSAPRFSSFADKEAQAALIYLTFKRPRRKLSTAAQYQVMPCLRAERASILGFHNDKIASFV